MSGYTPLFGSLTKGTLCGRWPDIGLWPIVLSLSDKNGIVDVTPAYIAGVTGLPVEEVAACLRRFCEPDPYSRSPDANGARLVLLDAHRDWGWHIVNHAQYREKARKAAYDSDRVVTGQNKQRMEQRRHETREDPTRPAKTRADPLSDADADSNSDRSEEESGGHRADARSTDNPPADGNRKEPAKTATRLPADWPLTPERQAVAVAERIDPGRTHAKFCDYWRALNGAKARKLDWEATWRNWCRTDADRNRPPSGSAPKESYADRSSREFMERMAARDKLEAEEAASANH